MKKTFMCSLCRGGIIGGALYLDRFSVTYQCQKTSIDERDRKIVLFMTDIMKITWKWIIFPVATFHMNDGERVTFIIFNKRRFNKWFEEYRPW